MKFMPLIRLRLQHSYYTDGRCPDFHIEPAADTEKWLKNQRCILKLLADGVQVLTAVNPDNTPFIPLPDTTLLHFYLYLKNQDFALFTDMVQIAAVPDPLYTNLGSENEAELTLVSRQPHELPPPPKGIFAEAAIFYSPAQADPGALFHVNFAAKQARWRYYVIADHPDAQFQIQDSDSTPLTFGDGTYLNQQPDSEDEIAQAVATRYPHKQYYRFLSDDLIACQQQARKSLLLHLNEDQIAGALPNPSLLNFTLAMTPQNNTQKEETMFEIIKYFTHDSKTIGGL
jgi:hypothetical protein